MMVGSLRCEVCDILYQFQVRAPIGRYIIAPNGAGHHIFKKRSIQRVLARTHPPLPTAISVLSERCSGGVTHRSRPNRGLIRPAACRTGGGCGGRWIRRVPGRRGPNARNARNKKLVGWRPSLYYRLVVRLILLPFDPIASNDQSENQPPCDAGFPCKRHGS